jgi:hypothetical protein
VRAPVQVDPMTNSVVECWNLMGGTIEWAAIGPLAEMLGVNDAELLVRGLVHLRNHSNRGE